MAAHRLGININDPIDYAGDRLYADLIRMSRSFRAGGSADNPELVGGQLDAAGWPTVDFSFYVWHGITLESGTYTLRFNGRATVTSNEGAISTSYSALTNTSTGAITLTNPYYLSLSFSNTYRTNASAVGTGVTNIELMRPGYTFPSADPSLRAQETTGLFHTPIKTLVQKFEAVRYMGFSATNWSKQKVWADRPKPADPSFHRLAGSGWGTEYGWEGRGGCWEHLILLANWFDRDAHICIPGSADNDYITKVAQMFKYGSDGVTPYTSPQANPIFPPLAAHLNLYVEYSNEVWNWSFAQAVDNLVAWQTECIAANGNIPENYDNSAVTAAAGGYAAWDAGTTYIKNAKVSYNGWSWENGADSSVGVTPVPGSDWHIVQLAQMHWRRYTRRTVDISLIFRTVFGDSAMMTRIRPLHMTQQPNGQQTQMTAAVMLFEYYGGWFGGYPDPHPPSYFIYGHGGSGYYNAANYSDLTVDDIFSGLRSGTMTPAGFGTPDSEGWNKTLDIDAIYPAALGVKKICYEGGPSFDRKGEPSDTAQAAAVNDPRITTAILNNHDAWSAHGGDLFMYFMSVGDFQWGFTSDVNNLDTPKFAAIDALNASQRAPVTFGTAVGVSVVGSSPAFNPRGWGLSGSLSSTDVKWNAYVIRSDTGHSSVTVSLTKTGTGTAQVYVDGAAGTSSDGGATWNVQNLSAGLHGVVVRATSGSFTVNSFTVNGTAGSSGTPALGTPSKTGRRVPKFSLSGNQVVISSPSTGDAVYWSTTGSPKRTTSNRYTGAITVPSGSTIYARAWRNGERLPVSSITYTVS